MALNIPVTVGDLVSVQVGCYKSGQTAINTFHSLCTAITGTPTLGTVAEAYDALLAPLYKPAMTNAATYYGIKVTRVLPEPRSMAEISAANIGNGTGGTDGLPAQVSGIITLETVFGGVSNRGRIFIPFPDESVNDADNNVPDSGYVTTLQSLGDAIVAPILAGTAPDTATMEAVLFHKALGTYTNFEQAHPRQAWATQRSRGIFSSLNRYPPF